MKTTNQNSTTGKQDNATFQLPTSYVFHEDPGHGWLEVPYQALKLLKIEDKVTGYSYIKDQTVFLEEDLDAPLFIKSFLVHIGKSENDFAYFWTICDRQYAHVTFIRNLKHYS